MSKRKKDSPGGLSEQLSLLDMMPSEEGSLDMSLSLKDCLSRSMKRLKIARWDVSSRISQLVGRTVSKEMLDNYCSPSKEHEIRASDLTAFCLVCDTLEPLLILTEPLGATVLTPAEAGYAEIARMERMKENLDQKIREKKLMMGV